MDKNLEMNTGKNKEVIAGQEYGILSLVLGIIAVLTGTAVITGLLAIFFGRKAKKINQEAPFAKIGIILGWVSIIEFIALIIAFTVYFAGIKSLVAIGILGGIAIVMALILAFADSKLKVEDDPRAVAITAMLPGYNCGACGFPGCAGLANSIVMERKGSQNDCKPANADQKARIADYRAANGI